MLKDVNVSALATACLHGEKTKIAKIIRTAEKVAAKLPPGIEKSGVAPFSSANENTDTIRVDAICEWMETIPYAFAVDEKSNEFGEARKQAETFAAAFLTLQSRGLME